MYRDYATLFRAVSDLDVEVRITATSAFGRNRKPFADSSALPPNVLAANYDYTEMRRLYAAARFVVVPLHEVDFQAGVTVILEAMAMGKAVIVSRASGQTDIIHDPRNKGRGQVIHEEWPGFLNAPGIAETLRYLPTGLYVTPGDPDDLRQAIQYLLDHPEMAEELGHNGRHVVEAYFGLDSFVQRFAAATCGEPLPIDSNY